MKNFVLGFVIGAWAWPIITDVFIRTIDRMELEKASETPDDHA